MRLRMRTIGLLGMVTALAIAACGGDDDTPTSRATATRVAATATPADTPTPIVITVAGTPMVVTATPAPTSTPAPTAMMTRKPTGTLNVIDELGTEQYLPRLATAESPLNYLGDPLVWWDWGEDGPTNEAILESWDLVANADGSVDYDLVIKPGVKYHQNWGEVTSTDIKFHFTENLKEGTVNGNRRIYGNFYGSDPDNLDDSDPLVLKVHQPEKFNVIETFRVFSAEETRGVRPFPKAYLEQVGEDEFSQKPIFAGTYEFTSAQRGYDVVITAVDDHYRVTPGFKQIHYFKVLDQATKIAMLRTGQVDIVTVPGKLAAEVDAAGVELKVSVNAIEPFMPTSAGSTPPIRRTTPTGRGPRTPRLRAAPLRSERPSTMPSTARPSWTRSSSASATSGSLPSPSRRPLQASTAHRLRGGTMPGSHIPSIRRWHARS